MLDNNLYNLMTQLVEEHKSLYRIKNMYVGDAKKCKECQEFWKDLIEDKECHIQNILCLIQPHFSMDMEKKKFYYYAKGEKKASRVKKKK